MFKKVSRTWGDYIVLWRSKKLCIKILLFLPNSSLSVQRHKYRSEYWWVFSGWGDVIITDNVTHIKEGVAPMISCLSHCTIKPNVWHQFLSRSPCTIIEFQYGEDVREDDIERMPI